MIVLYVMLILPNMMLKPSNVTKKMETIECDNGIIIYDVGTV